MTIPISLSRMPRAEMAVMDVYQNKNLSRVMVEDARLVEAMRAFQLETVRALFGGFKAHKIWTQEEIHDVLESVGEAIDPWRNQMYPNRCELKEKLFEPVR